MANISLNNKLKQLRKANHYTQAQVAEYLDVVQQTYSHYENGRRLPDLETLYKLAKYYDVPIETFVNTNDDASESSLQSGRPLGNELGDYLDYINEPGNQKKYRFLNRYEKEMLYYYEMLTPEDQEEMIEIARLKIRRKSCSRSQAF